MAAPSFVKAGTGAIWQSGAGVSCSVGTTTAGNIIILHVLIDTSAPNETLTFGSVTNLQDLGGTTGALTAISDQTTGSGTNGLGTLGANGQQYIFIGRSTAGGTCSLTVAGGASGNDLYFRLYEFTAVNTGTTLASVIENGTAGAIANTRNTGTSVDDCAVVTLGSDRLALNFVGINDDATGLAAFTGTSGGTWTMPAIFESATGTDGTIALMTATIASAGTIDGGTATITSDPWGDIGFALISQPAAQVFGTENVYALDAVSHASVW